MHYLLNKNFSLCGYLQLPYALFDEREWETSFYNKEEFLVLLKCDGITEIIASNFNKKQSAFLKKLLSKGVVKECSDSDRLSPEQEYKRFNAKYREDIQLSITGRCNFKCRHCFQGAPSGKLHDPSFDELMNIADQMAECGIRNVYFTGGEPLIRKDFWEVYEGFTERGIRISSIFSNGWLINESFVSQLNKRVRLNGYKPSFSISFDGVGEHDWLRGVEGAEESALNAIKLLKSNGYTVDCAFCIHKKNIYTIRDTINLLADLGVGSIKMSITKPEGLWIKESKYVLSTKEGWQAIIDYLPYFYIDGAPLKLSIEGCFNNFRHSFLWNSNYDNYRVENWQKCITCPVLKTHFYISPGGAILPCMNMGGTHVEKYFPNIKTTKLTEALHPSSDFVKLTELYAGDYAKKNSECANCELISRCLGGCRACGSVEGNGSYFDRDNFACAWHKEDWREKFVAAVEDGVARIDADTRKKIMENDAKTLQKNKEKFAPMFANNALHDGARRFRH